MHIGEHERGKGNATGKSGEDLPEDSLAEGEGTPEPEIIDLRPFLEADAASAIASTFAAIWDSLAEIRIESPWFSATLRKDRSSAKKG